MTFREYMEAAMETCLPEAKSLDYMSLGFRGELGEICNKLQKVIRGDYALEDIREYLLKEAGDLLWYTAGMAYLRERGEEQSFPNFELSEISAWEYRYDESYANWAEDMQDTFDTIGLARWTAPKLAFEGVAYFLLKLGSDLEEVAQANLANHQAAFLLQDDETRKMSNLPENLKGTVIERFVENLAERWRFLKIKPVSDYLEAFEICLDEGERYSEIRIMCQDETLHDGYLFFKHYVSGLSLSDILFIIDCYSQAAGPRLPELLSHLPSDVQGIVGRLVVADD